MPFGFADRVLAEVENAGCEHGIGLAGIEDLDHVLEVSGATAGDDRDADCGGNRGRKLDVVAGLGAIGVHAGEENFACAAAPDFAGPLDRVEADGRAAAVGIDAPFARTFALGIDRDDDALAAEGFGAGIDQARVFHRGGVDANLVRAGEQHFAHVIDRADAAADRERDETMLGRAAHDIDHRAALVG